MKIAAGQFLMSAMGTVIFKYLSIVISTLGSITISTLGSITISTLGSITISTLGSITISTFAANLASAASNEIGGFRFQTCNDVRCFRLVSARASVSHLNFGFTTIGEAHFTVMDRLGKPLREISGNTATYYPEIATVSLDDDVHRKTYLISLRTDRIEEFASGVKP